jgi:hypothetical protein
MNKKKIQKRQENEAETNQIVGTSGGRNHYG